jgi:DNA-binding NarL/FixJ family response regulator
MTRILLADDHEILREGLESLLRKEPGFEVVASVGDGRSALNKTKELKPDVLILDIGMPEMNGVDVARQVSHEFPDIRIIGLSVHTETLYIKRMIQSGAVGYLPKDCASDELCTAIHAVVSGRTYIGKSLMNTTSHGFMVDGIDAWIEQIDRLTVRERQVLQLLAEGCSVKESGTRLNISTKTAEVHRKNIREKIGIHSIAELTKYAIRMGITEP